MIRHPSLIIMLAFFLRSFSFAADNPAARHLAPFADDQTIAILHLDVDRLDVDALQKKLQDLSGQLGTEEQRQTTMIMSLGMPVLKSDQEAFTKAGGHHVY